MANRWFNQFKGSLEKGVVQLDGYARLSAADASVVSETLLGASIARTGTGTYTITLEDQYPKLLAVAVLPVSLGTNANQVFKVKDVLDKDGVTCGATMLNVKSIVICSCASNGTPTDVTVDCGFMVRLALKNSVA